MQRHPTLRLVAAAEPVAVPESPEIALSIDCDDCIGLHTGACADCMVTHLLGAEPGGRVELDRDEFRQVELLTDAGLVPKSRFRSRHGVA